MNFTNNVVDITDFQTSSDNIRIAYKQSTYAGSRQGIFNSVRNGITLVGGAEYDDVLFLLQSNNTVTCRGCTEQYMVYYSDDPTYSNQFVSPLAPDRTPNVNTAETDEGFFTTQNSVLLAGGTTVGVAVIYGANANF